MFTPLSVRQVLQATSSLLFVELQEESPLVSWNFSYLYYSETSETVELAFLKVPLIKHNCNPTASLFRRPFFTRLYIAANKDGSHSFNTTRIFQTNRRNRHQDLKRRLWPQYMVDSSHNQIPERPNGTCSTKAHVIEFQHGKLLSCFASNPLS